jgi:phosphomannomutase
LFSKVGRHFYDRVDVHLSTNQRQTAVARIAEATPDTLAGQKVQKRDQLDGYRFEVDGAWLLLRPSGTEPLLRIYTETTDVALVKPLLDAGRELAGV